MDSLRLWSGHPLLGEGRQELSGCLFAQGTVRPDMVVVLLPPFEGDASAVDRREPVKIQTIVAERTVEAFDECVLLRFAGLNEIELDVATVGPGIKGPAGELGAVVGDKRLVDKGGPWV